MMHTTREVLERTRSIVEAGWCQGENTDGRGNFCLRAAIGIASEAMVVENGEVRFALTQTQQQLADHVAATQADLEAKRRIIDFLPEPFVSIPVFNDDAMTTKNDVLGILDKAIAAC